MTGFESGGFTSDKSGLEFYWSGNIPDAVEAVVSEAKASGVSIKIRSINYSWDQVYELGRTLVDSARERGVQITEWGPNRTHDVIEFSGPSLSLSPREQQVVLALADETLPDNIKVAFLDFQQAEDADSRHSDSGNPTIGAEVQRFLGAVGLGAAPLAWHYTSQGVATTF